MLFDKKTRGKEWADIDHINPRLRAFLLWLDEKCVAEFQKEICITSLGRTLSQNQKAGGRPNSFHLFRPVCAADIRTTNSKWFTQIQQEQIVEWFHNHHACRTGDKCSIERKKFHIHIQMEFSPNQDLDEIEIMGVQ